MRHSLRYKNIFAETMCSSFCGWGGEVDIDLPISIKNTALQGAPDYRFRGGV